jgi:hypothetical protein
MKKSDIKKLDKIWSEKIRSKGKCELCGKSDNLNSHHIIGRRNFSLRWSVPNGVCLCSGCHVFNRLSAHQDPLYFHQRLTELRPKDIEYIQEQRNIVKKQTYDEVLNDLRGDA